MQEVVKLFIGIFILLLGIPLGNYLANLTKEELRSGQVWFRLIIISSLIGAIVSVFLKNDVLLFSFLFIAIVTSRSLIKDKKKKK